MSRRSVKGAALTANRQTEARLVSSERRREAARTSAFADTVSAQGRSASSSSTTPDSAVADARPTDGKRTCPISARIGYGAPSVAVKIRIVDEDRRFPVTDAECAAGSKGAPFDVAGHALAAGVGSRAVVLVEGVSDQCALEALAERRHRNLDAEGVSVVPIGGAHSIGRFLNLFGPQGFDIRLAGLCDAAEEGDFRRGLERAGLGSNLTRAEMESLGFYVCVADLEEELIRSLGSASVEQIVDAQGDLGSFRTFQKQPAWRGRASEQQLRRFMGSGGRRKIRYARLLIDALDLTQVPRPLDLVLAHV